MKTLSLALFSSLSLALGACGGQDDDEAPDTLDVTSNELTPVTWRNCGVVFDRDVRCAEIAVPLDHDDPGGPSIEISINRIPANPDAEYKGVLFVNPGGPGESGQDMALGLILDGTADALAPGYDIVGFDPRGVGDSGERGCGPTPTTDMEYRVWEDVVFDITASGMRCENAWGPLFDHLGSNQVVRDMEVLRRALGEAKFNFLGVSYGTRLGSLYAHMFPETAGAILLDASMTPDMDLLKDSRRHFDQLLVLQDVFFQDCDAGVLSCPPNARALFDEMLAAAEEVGLASALVQRWSNGLAYSFTREELPLLLDLQATELDADWIIDELSEPGIFDGLAQVAGRTVTCIDLTAPTPTIRQVQELYAELLADSPVFADQPAGQALSCTGWPVTRDPVPLPSAPTAMPVLVVGGTQDLLTPLANAEEMTAALGNATLLVSNHYGHAAISNLNECLVNAIGAYFGSGQVPAPGTVCDPQ
jgi:pimeloyl-ACP methyl ester carboxylesterase